MKVWKSFNSTASFAATIVHLSGPWLLPLCLLTVCGQALFAQMPQSASEPSSAEQYFSQYVLPILREHCFECHSHASGEASGNLMLDSLAGMTVGGTRGAAVTPGSPTESLLLKAIEYSNTDLQMPPADQLTDAQIGVIRQWIASGAVMPDSMRGEAIVDLDPNPTRQLAARAHWAYQPPLRWQGDDRETPCREAVNPIDAIVTSQLTTVGLSLSPRAERVVLLRRLSYDLTGLPPSIPATRDYLHDPRDDRTATEEVIDRLLASPSFGERWARVWMDVARYADTKGYVFREDREYPAAHQYRSWLIDAFNQDLPYDQFVTRQLAADLLLSADKAKPNATADLPALGFLTLGRRFLNNKHDIIDDRLDVVARGLMGMTLGCARCHDHKYDPLTQADYYALFGVFLNTDEPGGEPWPHRLVDAADERPSFILIRGSPGNRGAQVERRFVSLLAPDERPFSSGSGRLELAAQIVSPQNPLTARVFANRLWLQLTGSSLVESPSDFGLRSAAPKQLALLDHLATSLVEESWSMKRLVRSIVTSQVYQQSSLQRAEPYALDPENSLFWKMNRRRLDFEALRDTLLLRTGELDAALHGKSETITTEPFSRRRTVYAYIDRQNLPQLFRTFDLASPDTHTPVRAQTSVPQQGLFLLNSDFVAELSRQLAGRAESAGTQHSQQAAWMFEQFFARLPNDQELALILDFLKSEPSEVASPNSASPLERLAGGLLAANELSHID